jgi:hypothetical protein
MSDRLTVKGLRDADGTYDFDLQSLVSINGPEALNLREQQRIKILTGYRGLEIREAVKVLDPAMMVALVEILVARGGKTINTARVWDAKFFFTAEDEVADLESYRLAVDFHLAPLGDGDESIKHDQEEGEQPDPEA